MKGMNLKPTFKYTFVSLLRSAGVFYAIITAVIVFLYLSVAVFATSENDKGVFGGYGFSAGITVFVFGICTVRDALRMGIQHGISRRSSYVAQMLSYVSVSFVMAVAGEILTAGAQVLSVGYKNFRIADMYQMLYLDSFSSISPLEHVKQAAFNFTILIAASFLGMFISLVFYRLSKKWTIIVAVGVPTLLFALPTTVLSTLNAKNIATQFTSSVVTVATKIFESPLYLTLMIVAATLLLALFNWLLTRRAPIKPA